MSFPGSLNCFHAGVYYCAAIEEAENFRIMEHGLLVARTCHRSLETLNNVWTINISTLHILVTGKERLKVSEHIKCLVNIERSWCIQDGKSFNN